MTARRYTFEGQPRTVAEILAMMPAYSEKTVREYFRADSPPTTRAEFFAMATKRQAASALALRKNAVKAKVTFNASFSKSQRQPSE